MKLSAKDSEVLVVGAGPAGPTLAIERAIRSQGMPVTVRDVPDRIGRDIYGYDPILLRPDLHAVWRGHATPENAAAVAAIATAHFEPD